MSLARFARWCYAFRWPVIVAWLLALAAGVLLLVIVDARFVPDTMSVRLPGTESQRALDVLEKRFPAEAGDTATIVFRAPGGVMASETRRRVERFLQEVAAIDHVAHIESPYTREANAISADERIARATVTFDARGNDLPANVGAAVMRAIAKSRAPGLEIAFASQIEQFSEGPESGSAAREAVALVVAAVVLLITFGTVVAAGLPLLTAALGSGIGTALISLLLTRVMALESVALQLAMMIGLGAGIDYALLIVSRYRQGLDAGCEPPDAIAEAIATAGRTSLVAGGTVIVSMAGVYLLGLQFLQSMALGVIVVVLLIMLVSVTFLPALLGVVGRGVNRLRLPFPGHRSAGASAYLRWSHVVQRRPLVAALIVLPVLIGMGLPVFSMRLGFGDAQTEGGSNGGVRAYELLAEGFGPGFNGPLLVVAQLDSPREADQIERLPERLASTPGIAFVGPVTFNARRDAAVIQVVPSTSPSDARTDELVHRLRSDVIPAVLAGDAPSVSVGGITAFNIDLSDLIARRLPVMIAIVAGASFLLLMVVFRSLLVPLKAVAMNILSVGAAYGALVAVFQWGWLNELVGVAETAPIPSFLPPILFAILFGLSMDYEVFLLSRIREKYLLSGNSRTAVSDGLAATGRVITGAAAIMVTIFLAFALIGGERPIKMAGVGLATAIFVDATLVRMVLVPAVMELLGDANWWLPGWVGRLLPGHIEHETKNRRSVRTSADERHTNSPESVQEQVKGRSEPEGVV
ncbi:MAG: MMPL family transporter [Actinobacteria bacterium]|nr:MMPL family transporter [Actinomycetota bacterium]